MCSGCRVLESQVWQLWRESGCAVDGEPQRNGGRLEVMVERGGREASRELFEKPFPWHSASPPCLDIHEHTSTNISMYFSLSLDSPYYI